FLLRPLDDRLPRCRAGGTWQGESAGARCAGGQHLQEQTAVAADHCHGVLLFTRGHVARTKRLQRPASLRENSTSSAFSFFACAIDCSGLKYDSLRSFSSFEVSVPATK